MKRFINYWRYTKSIGFMLRVLLIGAFVKLSSIFGKRCLKIASKLSEKGYIFNTPFGKYICDSVYAYAQMDEYYEKDVGDIIKQYSSKLSKGDEKILIDIGANIGRWAIDLAKNFDYNVIAFEPAPQEYHRFLTNIAFNQLLDKFLTYNIGLGNDNGLIKFENTLGTFYNVDTTGDHNISEISVRRFDDLKIDDKKINNTRLIIMDVEGYELSVLKGMEKSLKKFHDICIIVEIRPDHKDKEKVIDFMKNLGYSVEKIGDENYKFSK